MLTCSRPGSPATGPLSRQSRGPGACNRLSPSLSLPSGPASQHPPSFFQEPRPSGTPPKAEAKSRIPRDSLPTCATKHPIRLTAPACALFPLPERFTKPQPPQILSLDLADFCLRRDARPALSTPLRLEQFVKVGSRGAPLSPRALNLVFGANLVKTKDTGELRGGVHGATAPKANSGGRIRHLRLLGQSRPSIRRSTHANRR